MCVSVCARLTDEICLAGVDGVLQLIGGDTELILWWPVNGDGVVGSRAQFFSDGRRVRSYTHERTTKNDKKSLSCQLNVNPFFHR